MAIILVSAAFAPGGRAQNGAEPSGYWKRIAGTTINEGLADAAIGPITAVWYAATGTSLLARTAAGRVFETNDFQHWRLNTTDTAPPVSAPVSSLAAAARVPEAGARVQPAGTRL